ncbi:hypothetical protein ACP70R_004555 [Stipagrostis hirtigluma subsp. patula]
MDAPGAHRRAGEARGDGGVSNSIAKHVGIQNQVLKWLQDFSDRVEERAKGAATEVNGLLVEAEALELDMKTAVVAFDNLTRQRKISEEDDINMKKRSNMQNSKPSQVPAQDYERDILPRYKEALHIGLTSCKDHFQKKGRSTTSVFRAMSTHGPLPHIIGSEEYNHDHSCGLADDVQPLADDFSWLREFQGESSDSKAGDLFGSQMLGVQQGFEKEETDSLVSATRQFKAMLEAALVNPYEFVDPGLLTRMGEVAVGRLTEADNAEETQLLASLQDPDINVHDLYSALVREGLFDPGDEILATHAASGSANPAIVDSAERAFSMNKTFPSEDKGLIERDDATSPSEQKGSISESSKA